MNDTDHPRFKRLFWKLYWFRKYPRFQDSEYKTDKCSWCKETKQISNHEIWCEADERGHIVLLCDDCASMCTG